MSNIEDNTRLLIKAAETGDASEVQRLIPISDPKGNDSEALYVAAIYGHARCVELLLPVSDPQANGSYGLKMAARNGHTQCVKLLIPSGHPKTQNSCALQLAVEYGHTQCVELLYPVSAPISALKELQQDYPDDYTRWGHLYEMIEAERLNTVLHTKIGERTSVKVQRKM